MKPERWQRIEALFHRAVDLPTAEREALLELECADDADLRARVERMLRDDERTSDLLDFEDTPPTLRTDPLIGRELGVYRIVARIAAGGMGVVYRAERTDGLFEHEVAVKLIRGETASAETLRRFELERRTLAGLNHPNIARLYDGGTTDDGSPYIVMELVHGIAIDRFCTERNLTIAARLRLAATVCRAVHFAHQNLVVHRDIKPSNILVDESGAPKLLDFGIARLLDLDGDEDGEPTQTLARILTPEYASPEQLTGGALTTATDVYSLGVVLYGLITGKRPFRCESRSPAEWERIVTERPPTKPSTAVVRGNEMALFGPPEPSPEEFAERCGSTPARLRRRLAGDLDRIVLMALRKEPERRYASAQELGDDIERQLAGEPVRAREDSLLYLATRFTQRHRLAVAATAAVLAALIFGIVAARRGEKRATHQAQHARIEADSFREIARFLMDTFLRSTPFEEEVHRERARESVQRHAARVRLLYTQDEHLRANLLDALGRVCLALDHFEMAQELFAEAFEVREQHFGAESLEVALSLASLGELQYLRGEYEAAAASMRRALELHRTLPVGTHTDVATTANNLAVMLRNTGEREESEQLHLEALALRRAEGDGSLPVAESLNNLSGIELDRGEYDRGRDLLDEALEIRRTILGNGDPLTLQTISNLAIVTWHLGGQDRALELMRESASGLRALRTEGRSSLAVTLSSLGAMELEAGLADEAEGHLAEALEIQVERLGSGHPAVASILGKQALALERRGRPAEALQAWEQSLTIYRADSSAPPRVLGRALQEFGILLSASGDLQRAESVLRESVELLSNAPSPEPALLGRARITLGHCLVRQRRFDDAESELNEGLSLLEEAPGVGEDQLEVARARVAELAALRAEEGGR